MPCRHTPLILERTSPGAMCVRPAAVVSSTLVMTWLPWGSVSKSNPNESFFRFFCKTNSDDLTLATRWTTRFFPKFIRIPRITRLPTARNLCFGWTGNASRADSTPEEFSFTDRLASFIPRATWNTSRVEAANRVSMSSWPAGGIAPFTCGRFRHEFNQHRSQRHALHTCGREFYHSHRVSRSNNATPEVASSLTRHSRKLRGCARQLTCCWTVQSRSVSLNQRVRVPRPQPVLRQYFEVLNQPTNQTLSTMVHRDFRQTGTQHIPRE
jgi:hypothetical protein